MIFSLVLSEGRQALMLETATTSTCASHGAYLEDTPDGEATQRARTPSAYLAASEPASQPTCSGLSSTLPASELSFTSQSSFIATELGSSSFMPAQSGLVAWLLIEHQSNRLLIHLSQAESQSSRLTDCLSVWLAGWLLSASRSHMQHACQVQSQVP